MVDTRPKRTLGPEHDPFWEATARGELRVPRCETCQDYSWPPVAMCGTCGGTGFAWPLLSGRGKLVSWCTFERDYYRGQFALPWETILVELEEGPLLLSNPVGLSWRDMAFEMPMRVAFLECEDDAGRFSLPVFQAAES